jgi:hypothetical protein
MPKSPTWLLEHRRDVHSQAGEDGVIEAILERLPVRDRWCVEFGAWDGRHCSNTRNLIDAHGYSAVLIEGDPAKARALREALGGRTGIVTLERYVGFAGEDRLDALLAGTGTPRDFDLLSIDIDGNDHGVWEAVVDYQPKVVCIEFNPTIPLPVRYVQPADPKVSRGSSLAAIVELGSRKGYELVAVTMSNAFFVRAERLPLFDLESNDPARLWTDQRFVTHLFSGYDGTLFIEGFGGLPWHGVDFHASRLQPLPRALRHPSAGYNAFRRALFFVWLLVREPRTLLHKLRKLSRRR